MTVETRLPIFCQYPTAVCDNPPRPFPAIALLSPLHSTCANQEAAMKSRSPVLWILLLGATAGVGIGRSRARERLEVREASLLLLCQAHELLG
jgi:hypothetical protein